MVRKMITVAALAASFVTGAVPTVAMAHPRYDDSWGQQRDGDQGGDRGWYRRHRDDGRGYEPQGYYDRGYYAQAGYRDEYRARPDYGYRCHRDGTTGAIIGALAGGLLGHGLAGHGDRAFGTILGGGAGAVAGRAIERSGNSC
jgi:hypothetical protein